MRRFFLVVSVFAVCSSSQAGTGARAIWHLPPDADFDSLSSPLKVRGDGKLAIYWSASPSSPVHTSQWVQRTLLDLRTGRELQSDEVPGQEMGGDGLCREAWGNRHTHAFLPRGTRFSPKRWLRLKNGNSYRVLRFLPRFDEGSLQDIAFTPDGGTLYVLGRSRLWKIGAQSGRLLAQVRARRGDWSRENAALSRDTKQIVGMREGITLFSTRTGRLVRRFGVKLETLTGHCGSLEARVGFEPDGRRVFAQMQGEETWVYSRRGTPLWHGQMPFIMTFAPDNSVIDLPISSNRMDYDVALLSMRDGSVSARVSGLHTDNSLYSPIAITPDSRALFYVQDRAVWKITWSPARRSRS